MVTQGRIRSLVDSLRLSKNLRLAIFPKGWSIFVLQYFRQLIFFSFHKSTCHIFPAKNKTTNYIYKSKALFRCEKILDLATVALSFVCDNYCLIMD